MTRRVRGAVRLGGGGGVAYGVISFRKMRHPCGPAHCGSFLPSFLVNNKQQQQQQQTPPPPPPLIPLFTHSSATTPVQGDKLADNPYGLLEGGGVEERRRKGWGGGGAGEGWGGMGTAVLELSTVLKHPDDSWGGRGPAEQPYSISMSM